jgi:hypothetical protein
MTNPLSPEQVIAQLEELQRDLYLGHGLNIGNRRIEAAVQLIQQMQVQASGWIAVSERLPHLDVPVLAVSAHYPNKISAAMRVDGGDGWMWAVANGYFSTLSEVDAYEVDDDYQFSHWQPLPSPPSPSEKAE